MKILCADDDETWRNIFRRMFQEAHTVELVTNGEELLEKLRNGTYDLIITDNQMPPGMSGLSALGHIRGNVLYDRLPVIVVSGDEGDEFRGAVKKLDGILIPKGAETYSHLWAEVAKIEPKG